MKLKGIIELLKSKSRLESDPKYAGPALGDDHLLALKITHIDGQEIKNLTDTRDAVKNKLPKLSLNGTAIDSSMFGDYTVLPGMQPVSHISLAYAVYFREGTKPTGKLIQKYLDVANTYVGKEIELEVGDNDLELVVCGVCAEHADSLTVNGAKKSTAPQLGAGRDTVFNLVPNAAGQAKLSEITQAVCGRKCITTATNDPVHFHFTAAQANLTSTFRNLLGLPQPAIASAGGYNASSAPASTPAATTQAPVADVKKTNAL